MFSGNLPLTLSKYNSSIAVLYLLISLIKISVSFCKLFNSSLNIKFASSINDLLSYSLIKELQILLEEHSLDLKNVLLV